MIIKNKTCVPTDILESLIMEALKISRCKHSNFIIKFTSGKYLRGIAYSQNYLCKVILPISSKNGISFWWREDIALPLEIYKTIVHELDHISNYQCGYQERAFSPELTAHRLESSIESNIIAEQIYELTNWMDNKRKNPSYK